ncbi:methyltransferase domain-containing protein [Streptomyces sp. P01-B04]|uniref:Methyltransferase domain-containing protein n=1 Tax=Streptomyces poriferorum TaxID=2798799 RepID=A0ABY9IS56_9ACTN|nr:MULTISPECIES: class I SAM-dependent methyltransferase [Streptomyces]MBW5253582.1 methyltransferase domain-containing protein [Streptomyces poriferorum]MBW5262102.1 methyltransferase domain-containing protein [Streptomyces poriferorum]MDP5312839.1 methyltransferase domain-containing protein [Streptomyces sp. Alt4]WLQ58146.1 methyltransferase domain-containing protein [Streptomyces sp. Alt2]
MTETDSPEHAAGASRALSFDGAAAQYAAARPGYPAALFDAVEELAGLPLRDARTLDVGAGTGISTRRLHDRGARVVAVEPGPGMAAELRRSLPHVPLVRGDGNSLPFAGASADLITYAQSYHWTDRTRSTPEALRVLRPGGALALWWNVSDHAVPWVADQDTRLRDFFRDETGAEDESAHGAPARTRGLLPELAFAHRRVPWTRRIPLASHLANLSSHSAFLVLGEERTRRFLDEEREHLARLFPDGTVEEAYVVDLNVAVR